MQKNIYSANKTVLKNIIPMELPLCISIEPTNLCNFKCAMCFHGNNETDPKAKPLKNMDDEVFDKVLNDIKEWTAEIGERVKLIKLYSLGEPLINSNIGEMVRKIKQANVCEKIEITSNGSLLSKDIAQKLVDDELDIFRLSVYSVEKSRMKFVTRTEISPEAIHENIRYLKEYRDKQGGIFHTFMQRC